MLGRSGDVAFRETLYLMTLAFGRLRRFREVFGRAIALTPPQFVVLIGTAHCQGADGVSIRELAEHTQLAATHVTTEVGRLIGKGLLIKTVNAFDRRSLLVRLTPKGEAAIRDVAPLLRFVNNILFRNVSRREFAVVGRFLRRFARNSEDALAAIDRRERRRGRRRS